MTTLGGIGDKDENRQVELKDLQRTAVMSTEAASAVVVVVVVVVVGGGGVGERGLL